MFNGSFKQSLLYFINSKLNVLCLFNIYQILMLISIGNIMTNVNLCVQLVAERVCNMAALGVLWFLCCACLRYNVTIELVPTALQLMLKLLCPAPIAGGLSDDARLTSVTYIEPKSKTERPTTKIDTEVVHVTRD